MSGNDVLAAIVDGEAQSFYGIDRTVAPSITLTGILGWLPEDEPGFDYQRRVVELEAEDDAPGPTLAGRLETLVSFAEDGLISAADFARFASR